MGEGTTVTQTWVALVLLLVFVGLYVQGGRGHRALRWLLGGVVFSAGMNGLAAWTGQWSWPMLSALLAYPAALSMGYGGDTRAEKVRRRAWYGLGVGLASSSILAPAGVWWLIPFQVLFAVLVSVLYGLTNPLHAAAEEAQIAVVSVCLVMLSVIR